MERIEILFDEISESDPYDRSIEASKLIIKKDLTGLRLTEVDSCEKYTVIQNELGVKRKVYNDKSDKTRGYNWDDVCESTADEMTREIVATFNNRFDSIEELFQSIDQVEWMNLSREICQTAYETQEIIKKGFSNICRLSQSTDDREAICQLSIQLIEESDKIKEICDTIREENRKIDESEKLLRDCLDKVKDIKSIFTKK